MVDVRTKAEDLIDLVLSSTLRVKVARDWGAG